MAEPRGNSGGRSGAGGIGAKRLASYHATSSRHLASETSEASYSTAAAAAARPNRLSARSASATASTSTSHSTKGRRASSSKMPTKSNAHQGVPRPARRSSAQTTPFVAQGEPKVCRHCRATSTAFWCERCALAQLERFRDNIERVGQARDEARGRVSASLGEEVTSTTSLHALPDPFGPQAGEPHPIASHRGRAIRARWNDLFAQVGQRKSEQMRSDAEVVRLRERMQKKKDALAQRRAALDQARLLLDGASSAEKDVARLKVTLSAAQEGLTTARRRRQRALLDIYSVTPPSTSPSSATLHRARARNVPGAFEPRRTTHDAPPLTLPPTTDWNILPAHCRLALPLPTPSDIRRFPRQDVNAAAALVAQLLQRQAATCGVALPFSLGIDKDGRWALRSDPLWVGSGIDSKHSLHLGKSAYELMAGGGAGTGATSPAASTLASGAGAAFAREKIEASLASLRTSTFASLGSFVQLPGRNHQTWGRASVMRAGGGDEAASTPGEAAAPPSSASSQQSQPSPPSSTALSSAQTFCRALIMLAFNAAYLAWTQGAAVDLIAAGGSTLKLLAEAAAAPGLNTKSHTEGPLRSLSDFTFPALDFSKLLQLHELGSEQQQRGGAGAAPGVKGKGSNSSGSGVPSPSSRSASRQQQPAPSPAKLPGIEESYIDAGQAAASILDVRRATNTNGSPAGAEPSSSQKAAAATPKRQSTPLASAGADKSKLPPSSLSSLRQRGQDVARQGRAQQPVVVGPSREVASTRASPSPSPRLPSESAKATISKQPSPLSQQQRHTPTETPSAAKHRSRDDDGGGTVTFNGQRIALANTDSSSGGDDANSDGDEAARRRRRSSAAARRAGGASGGGSTRKKATAATAAVTAGAGMAMNGLSGADDDWDVV